MGSANKSQLGLGFSMMFSCTGMALILGYMFVNPFNL